MLLFYALFLVFAEILTCGGQRIGYCEVCNSTEECSDHRYTCRQPLEYDSITCFIPHEENALRCFCDRFHNWGGEDIGCVQLYNATEIMDMTQINVTDNIKRLEERVSIIIRTQIGAGIFVFVMVIVGGITVTIFCIYAHVIDSSTPRTKLHKCNRQASRPSTSTTQV